VELGVNDTIAKRGGLLHDIGKAIDREMEGTHLELGRQVLEKYGEKREIIHAMECHHGDYDPTTVEAILVNAADALSAARPGARREILENYVHRLERLEGIANAMEGVSKSFASSSTPRRSATSRRSGCQRTSPARSSRSCSIRGRSKSP